jgi:hypothetical protein
LEAGGNRTAERKQGKNILLGYRWAEKDLPISCLSLASVAHGYGSGYLPHSIEFLP